MMKYKLYAPLGAYSDYAINIRYKLEQSSGYKKKRVLQQSILLKRHHAFKLSIEKSQKLISLNNDTEPLSIFFKTYKTKIFKHAFFLCIHYSNNGDTYSKEECLIIQDNANDLVSVTLLKILEKKDLRYKKLNITYFYKSMQNNLKNLIRKNTIYNQYKRDYNESEI